MDNGAMSFTESAEVPKEGSEPIKLSDEERIADLIAKDAESKYGDRQGYLAISYGAGYLAGANAERERYKKLLKAVAELLRYDSSMKYAMTEKLQHWEIFVSALDTLVTEFKALKSDSK